MKLLSIIQIIVALALMITILLQSKGVGLSGIFGGGSDVYQTRRGIEKTLFVLTIILSILFFLIAIANLVY